MLFMSKFLFWLGCVFVLVALAIFSFRLVVHGQVDDIASSTATSTDFIDTSSRFHSGITLDTLTTPSSDCTVSGGILHEQYVDTPSDFFGAYSGSTVGQTFTADSDHFVSDVCIFVYRVGSPDEVTLSLVESSTDLPSGTVLASATLNANSVTDSDSGQWLHFVFTTPVDISSSVVYGLKLSSTATDGGNFLAWLMNYSGGSYPGGRASVNTGSWTGFSSSDLLFQVFDVESGGGGGVVSTTTPPVTDYAVDFGLAIIIFCLFLMVWGFFINSFDKHS